MAIFKKFIISIFILLPSTYSFQSHADQTISWGVTEEPPITYKEDGGFKGYGIEILNLLSKKVPGYYHKIFLAGNYARLTQQVSRGPLTCAMGLFRTEERLKVMYFSSTPVFFFFNIQVVMQRERYEAMGKPERVSLNELLVDTEYVLGISKGRTYVKELRSILEARSTKNNVQYIAQGNVSESLSMMVARNRIDYTLAYPEEAAYIAQQYGGQVDLVTVPIMEIDPLGVSWVACTKSPEGLKAINEINQALVSEKPKEIYRAKFEAWFGDNLLSLFRENYGSQFLAVTECSDCS